ncbi:MAG: nitroreductase family protein [Clostridia bacterium]|nr:nitroreductase family protein [Clostridia bacterium]
MNFSELIKDRYSVRKYKDKPVPEDILDRIIEAGMYAPTACNNQPQKIYVAKSKEAIDRLKECSPCIFDAPLVMVIGYDKTRSWQNSRMPGYESGETDASIVTTHMMLAAWNEGIGSCWVGVFNADDVAAALGLPENIRVTALMPMGYADMEAGPRHSQYREREDIVAEI